MHILEEIIIAGLEMTVHQITGVLNKHKRVSHNLIRKKTPPHILQHAYTHPFWRILFVSFILIFQRDKNWL